MKMKFLLAAVMLLLCPSLLRAAEPEWSKPVNELRARISLERQKDSPFLKVFIEFQNTSNTAGMMEIRFDPDAIAPEVTDEHGVALKKTNGPYDGMSPIWESIRLPFEGTMRFRISFPGLGYRPGKDRTIIDLGPSKSWVIPDDRAYFLSGVLTVKEKGGDRPYDWSGVLKLPKIMIPNTRMTNKGSGD